MKYCPLTRNERAAKLRIADLGRVAALTTGVLLFKPGLQVDFFLTSTSLELEFFKCALFSEFSFVCCRLFKLLLTRFSSKVDVVRSRPAQVAVLGEWL